MTTLNLQRRGLLRGVAAGLTLPALVGTSGLRAQTAAPVLQRVADDLHLISGAGGNVVLHKGERGLTVVDSGAAAHTTALLALIDEVAVGAPLHTLFNTHWHSDHSGGNEALRARGANIMAHENTKLWLGAEFEVYWRDEHHQPRPREAWPDTTFYTSGSLDLGTETAEYQHAVQAHTDGDAWLYFPNSKVLVLGGLMSDGSYPITDIASGGWIGGLIEANAAILEQFDADTLLVPERGPLRSMADLRAQHAMLEDVYTRMKVLAQDGHSAQEMLDAKVTAAHDASWGDPTRFVMETYMGMAMNTYNMGGFI